LDFFILGFFFLANRLTILFLAMFSTVVNKAFKMLISSLKTNQPNRILVFPSSFTSVQLIIETIRPTTSFPF